MGYTTYFTGDFTITPALTPAHAAYLREFSGKRRMRWNVDKINNASDPAREAVGLPIGPEGAYFTGAIAPFGQEFTGDRVTDSNSPAPGQPGLWCQWVPNEDGTALVWDEGEKFYNYEQWLVYLLTHFLIPWGYTLDGTVEWEGEDSEDRGRLLVENNVLRIQDGHIVYKDRDRHV